MALLSDIKNDLKQAMLDKNEMVRNTIRMFLAEVQRHEIDNKEEVDDSKALQIINKMIKQRNDSISQFKSGDRDDLADKEQQEVNILSHLLLHIYFIFPFLPSGSIFGTNTGVPFWLNLTILIYLSQKNLKIRT